MARNKIKFSTTRPRCDRQHCLSPDDINVLLSRLPYDVWQNLRAVHFNDQSRGARILGYVTAGRREIAICAVPPQMSLSSGLLRGQSPQTFGAIIGWQWPPLAIRRFMLYNTFLHELGHTQLINPKAMSERLRYARERKAEEFAEKWRKELWSHDFDHPDPVHNKPSPAELADLKRFSEAMSKDDKDMKILEHTVLFGPATSETHQNLGKKYLHRNQLDKAESEFLLAIQLDKTDGWPRLYLGNLYYQKKRLRFCGETIRGGSLANARQCYATLVSCRSKKGGRRL